MDAESFERACRLLERRAERERLERLRFESLSVEEQRIREALAEARRMLEQGASVELVECRLFDHLPEDATPYDVVAAVRSMKEWNAGTHALLGAGWQASERGAHAGRLSAERLREDRERFARRSVRELMAGL